MNRRLFAALTAAALLVAGVWFGQTCMTKSVSDLADRGDAIRVLLEEDLEEGFQRLGELSETWEKKQKFLFFVVNDGRIHEISEALIRAERSGEKNDISSASDALNDFSFMLRELSSTNVPTLENIF